jgi:hypothetical protein
MPPETEWQRKIYRDALGHLEDIDADSDDVRRVHLTFTQIDPVTKEDWHQYLDTFAFLSRIAYVHAAEDACAAVNRVRGVIMSRLVGEPNERPGAA